MGRIVAAAILLSFASMGSAAAQQVIYTAPVAGAVVGVPPYGVPCGPAYYPHNPTYAFPQIPWCPATNTSVYPAITSHEVIYSRPIRMRRVAYIRSRS